MNDQDGERECRDRWIDIALYAASAVVITILAIQLPLAEWLFYPLPQFVASAIAVALIISFSGRWTKADSFWAALGAKHFHRYPPIWLAAVLALSIVVILMSASDDDGPAAVVQRSADGASVAPIYCVLVAGLCTVAAWLLRRRNSSTAARPIPVPIEKPHTSETDSVEALLRWLNDDNPISSPFDDRFRHHLLAKRIATRLLDMESRPSVLLHGSLGAGKTGVARLVEHELRQTPSIRFIRISVWGHSTAESAVGGILGALVDNVATEASGLALRGVPAQYLDAIAQHGGAFASIARLAHTERQPEKVLARIDTIAKAIQIHFIVWVEDLERLRGDDSQPKMEANDAQRLGPIRAFLYLLHECGNIQVVIADAQRDTGVDFEKIARYTEVVPSIQRREVCRVLCQVRTILLPSSIIDPAAPDHRRKLKPIAEHDIDGLDRWLQQMGMMHSVPSEFIVHVAVADLLDTPRTMKQALRSARRTADVLKGEIDPDAILAISVIRTTHRRVFEIINDYIEAFRSGFPKPPNLATHPAISQLETYLKEREERVGKAIKALLRYLFPNYHDAGQSDPLAYVANPQGLHVNRHRDNWRAYLDEQIDDQSWSDQRALRSIREWRDGNPIALDPYFGSRAGHTQLGTFVGQFGGGDLLNLLRQIATDDSAAAPQNNAATSERIWLVRSDLPPEN
ncbi:MAG: P-loop NTPase fold protein [Planctomycetota bacterium]|nr:P-loop NTPase fold protein [Planctomycetota bacterium]